MLRGVFDKVSSDFLKPTFGSLDLPEVQAVRRAFSSAAPVIQQLDETLEAVHRRQEERRECHATAKPSHPTLGSISRALTDLSRCGSFTCQCNRGQQCPLGVGLYTTSNVVDFLLTSHRSRNHFSTAFLGGVVLMILSATVRSGLRVYAALTRFNPVVDPRITNIASAIMIGAMLSLAVNEQKMDQYAEKLLWRVACAICAYVVIYLFVVNPS